MTARPLIELQSTSQRKSRAPPPPPPSSGASAHYTPPPKHPFQSASRRSASTNQPQKLGNTRPPISAERNPINSNPIPIEFNARQMASANADADAGTPNSIPINHQQNMTLNSSDWVFNRNRGKYLPISCQFPDDLLPICCQFAGDCVGHSN